MSSFEGRSARMLRTLERRRKRIRVVLVAAVCASLVGAGCVGAALLRDGTQTVAASQAMPVGPKTPLLSARRVPEMLAQPTADRLLNLAVAPINAGAPEGHCLTASANGAPVVAVNAGTPLAPASNMKIVTAAVALDVLKPDTRFITRLAVEVEPLNGIVNGDVYLIGGGDPLVETANYDAALKYPNEPHTPLEELANALRDAGITHITGSVLADESRYDTVRTVPSWPDRYLSDGEVGPLSAMAVNDSRQLAGSQLSQIGSASEADPAAEPAVLAATTMTELLNGMGITVAKAPGAKQGPAEARELAATKSLSVTEIVGQMLRFSDNTTAELLLKEIGRTASNEGSTAAGVKVVVDRLKKWKLWTEGMNVVDGSGLDPTNRVTCKMLIGLLERDTALGKIAGGLAVPGENGTLRERFKNNPASDNVVAKTGTLAEVTALSGWVKSDPGALIAFSFLANRPGGRIVADDLTRQEQFATVLASYPQLPPIDKLSPLE